MDTALAEWQANRTGILRQPGNLRNQIAWVRLPDDATPFTQEGFSDPSPGPNSPHIEIYWAAVSTSLPNENGQVPTPPAGQHHLISS